MKKFLVVMSYLALVSSLWAADFSLNPARDFGAIRRINPTDYDGKSVVREDGTGLSSDTAAAFRAALEVFSKAEAEPAGAVAAHAALVSAHGATGAVVGTSNTQSLTNKTLTDASNHISGAVIDTGVVADANIASTIARDSEYIAADSAVLSAANASDALLLRLNGSRAMTGSLKFSATTHGICANTADGADNLQLALSGGGAYPVTRGATIYLAGNEFSTFGGTMYLDAGNTTTGDIIMRTGAGVERFRIGYDGTIKFSAALSINGNGGGLPFRHYYNASSFANIFGEFRHAGDSGGLLIKNINSSADRSIRFQTGTADGNETTKAMISAGGNLLIGTTTDDGTNKLQVNGSVKGGSYVMNADGNAVYWGAGTYIQGNNTAGTLNLYGTTINTTGALKNIGNTVWTAGNDGVGSGLDADTVPNATPASASAAGTAGMIRYDANYIYICTAANTWKRAAISTW